MNKVEAAKKAIDEVFSDMSSTPQDTRDELVDLREHVETCIAAIPHD